MSDGVLQLSVLSVVCGAVMSIAPEGGCKTVMQLLCTAALITGILTPIKGFDFESYALESTRLWQIEESFAGHVNETGDKLEHSVIEDKYREYILDKAQKLGVKELHAEITAACSAEGLWVPYSIELYGSWNGEQQKTLCGLIQTELGIPEERQQWKLE